MEKIYLSEVAKAIEARSAVEAEIKAVTTDSRKITKGCLFFALKGEKFDGADFVEQALEAGAAAAVTERAFDDERVLTVPDAMRALGKLAGWYKSRFDILTVAVTGSVGKTTTKQFIYSVLSEKYKTYKTEGNFNNEIGLPLTIFELPEDAEAAVFELGMNHFGELSRLSKIAGPDIAVITNIGVAHIENLGSREGIAKAKSEILDGLKKNGLLIYNADEPLLRGVAAGAEARSLSFGIDADADFRAESIIEMDAETDFIVSRKSAQFAVCIPAIGRHNVQNALAAAACGAAAGLSDQQIAAGLARFENTGSRQMIYDFSGIRIIDDTYNANPDSMAAALSVLASFGGGARYAVLADMLELGEMSRSAHREVGERAKLCCDRVFCFGENARMICEGFGDGAVWFEDCDEIAEQLGEALKKGDTVLFKGSRGMKVERVIEKLLARWGK